MTHKNSTRHLETATALILCLSLLVITIGCSSQAIEDGISVSIVQKSESKINMDNVRRVFLAGFQPQGESSFKMLSTIEDILKKELAIKSQFLLVFENPLQISDSVIVDKKKEREYSVSEGDIFEDEDVWKKIARSYRVDLIITGKVDFSNQIGKDIVKVRKFKDGKEIQISKLAKKRFFKLDLTLYFINGDTGKIIHTEIINKALGREEKTKESKELLLSLLRKSIPGIKSLIVVKRKPMRRTLLN